MHEFARLVLEDVEPAQAAGFPTFSTPHGPAMSLPCHCLDGTACRRYDQWRPSICSSYFCKLQKRLRAGETTLDEALHIVSSALKARSQVEGLIPPGKTLRDARIRFDALASSRHALAPEDAKLVVRVFALERWLDLHFRKPNAVSLPTAHAARSYAKPEAL